MIKRKIIEIDEALCNGCGQCVSACAEGAIAIVGGRACVVSDTYCDGLGNCIGECPQGALKIVEREAEAFDEAAVAKHLKSGSTPAAEPACQCPSAALRMMAPKQAAAAGPAPSALANWPVQLRLVPPHAPFLKGADLLVASDCTAFACGSFHADFLQGRVLLMGCPKLDDRELYVEKFTEIFRQNAVKSITVVVMEVPCCQGMPQIVKAGMRAAGASVPMDTVVIGVGGDIVERLHE
jgi:Fe-S-cluster-containing hydrogenase component 2